MSKQRSFEFNEYRVDGCCGMVEISNIEKRYNTKKTWPTVAQELTKYLDTHGLEEDNPPERYDYNSGRYVKRKNVKQNFDYGRRMCIASVELKYKDKIAALLAAGWKELSRFPGNHGNYQLALLGYVPNWKGNEKFLKGEQGEEEDYDYDPDEDEDF